LLLQRCDRRRAACENCVWRHSDQFCCVMLEELRIARGKAAVDPDVLTLDPSKTLHRRALGWVGTGHGVVKEHHDAIAGELVERPLEVADERPQSAVILAQKVEHLLRLGGLGEGGVAAQISQRWLSRIFSSPCETIISASCGARNRFSRPTRANSSTCSATRASRPRFISATSSVRWRNSRSSRAFSIAMTACAPKFCSSAICL